MTVKMYLWIKFLLEPIIFGPAIFWLLFIIFLSFFRSKYSNRKNLAKKVPVIGLVLIIILISPPLVEVISLPLYYRIPKNLDNDADAIVVLGGGVEDSGYPMQMSVERVYAGSKLLLQNKAPLLILSAGYTNNKIDSSEAEAMRIIALGMGVSKDRIILEERSYNTYTSALETKKLLEKHGVKTIILITSPHHLYRAAKVFEKTGIKIYPYPSRIPELFDWRISWQRPIVFTAFIHEYMAIIIYKIKGWL